MLAELREYARRHPVPENAPTVELVINYLSALNNVFESSLLGNRVRVFDAHGSTIQRMEGGFKFFIEWADEQCPEVSRLAGMDTLTYLLTIILTLNHTHTHTHTHPCRDGIY